MISHNEPIYTITAIPFYLTDIKSIEQLTELHLETIIIPRSHILHIHTYTQIRNNKQYLILGIGTQLLTYEFVITEELLNDFIQSYNNNIGYTLTMTIASVNAIEQN